MHKAHSNSSDINKLKMKQNLSLNMLKLYLNLLVIIVQFVMSFAALADYYPNCTNSPSFVPNSSYQTNLNDLLTNLISYSSATGYYNSSVGQGDDQVYGAYLCRGDASTTECRDCVDQAHTYILLNCSSKYRAVIWFEYCMLRYSNELFFQKLEYDPRWIIGNPRSISPNETRDFVQVLTTTAEKLVPKVANNTAKFGTNVGNSTGTLPRLYIVGQCTPDLNDVDCATCLRMANRQFSHTYGGRVMLPSCNVRFEFNQYNQSFYKSDTAAMSFIPAYIVPNTTSIKEKHNKSSEIRRVVVIVMTTVIAILLLFGGAYCFYIYRYQGTIPSPDNIVHSNAVAVACLLGYIAPHRDLEEIVAVDSLQFNFKTIRDATNNFSEHNELGQGGFGRVYKGKLQNGQEIAVKRLSTNSWQGDEEFKAEVLLVAKLQHKNLVRLLGFCLYKKEKLLVYELMPNASLDKVLLDQNRQATLDWETRYKILLGTARGLLYLHEDSRLKIIHRDLKSSNILLDENMNPKIADFGLARLVGTSQAHVDTNTIAGTYGYMAPEYALTGRFSVMSDVYSFGVIALEIISGHKCSSIAFPFEDESLCLRAWSLWRDGAIFDLVDPRLDGNYSSEEVTRCVHIALLCIQEDPNKRPTMAPIVSTFNGHLLALQEPEPPQVGPLTTFQYGSQREGQTSSSKNSENKDDTSLIYPR